MSCQGDAARARLTADAYVYISASRKLELIKIGWSKGSNRGKSLNKDGYGGAEDWILLYERKYKNSGWVEINAHKALHARRVCTDYERLQHGYSVKAKEMFCCTYEDALQAIESTPHEPLEMRFERVNTKGNFNYRT
jgi:T5orf172 domain-containing protein